METSNGNDSQKEEGELSDDEIEPERAPDNVPSAPRKDINELQNVNRNFDSRHNRLNTVWQDLPAPSMARSYPMGLPSSWDYNHGMGTLRYDRIRPMATPPPPPPQKWDPRENRPRLPNYRPLLPSPSPRMRNHHYSPSEYRNQPLRHVQQNTKQCILAKCMVNILHVFILFTHVKYLKCIYLIHTLVTLQIII